MIKGKSNATFSKNHDTFKWIFSMITHTSYSFINYHSVSLVVPKSVKIRLMRSSWKIMKNRRAPHLLLILHTVGETSIQTNGSKTHLVFTHNNMLNEIGFTFISPHLTVDLNIFSRLVVQCFFNLNILLGLSPWNTIFELVPLIRRNDSQDVGSRICFLWQLVSFAQWEIWFTNLGILPMMVN